MLVQLTKLGHREAYTIYPTTKYNLPPPPSKIVLHYLDLLGGAMHIRNHRFYHHPQSSITDVIDKLKSSLAEALELYPPVSGTVRTDENGDVCIFMDAENVLGTPFVVEMKETPYIGDSEDLTPRPVVLLPPGSSILAVKVTQVKEECSGMFFQSSLNMVF